MQEPRGDGLPALRAVQARQVSGEVPQSQEAPRLEELPAGAYMQQ